MTDRPILFSAPMIQALRKGWKTQTRRLLPNADGLEAVEHEGTRWRFRYQEGFVIQGRAAEPPRFRVGDRLWVRETYSGPYECSGSPPREWDPTSPIWYWADGNPEDGDWTKPKPGIHMPRWASRITLIVTDVRVERLQEISEEDAKAEGVGRLDPTADDYETERYQAELEGRQPYPIDPVWTAPGTRQGFGPRRDDPQWGPTPEFAFRLLWESINGPESWNANPWVVAVTFNVHPSNIDEL